MNSLFARTLDVLFALLLAAVLAIPQDAFAQSHVVSAADLQKDVVAASRAREVNLAKVEKFFSSDVAQKALKSAHMDSREVQSAVRVLSDQELARLAARADKSQRDFAAGALTNQEITYIIIALATAVLIIVIVVAR